MGTEGFASLRNMTLKCFFLLLASDFISCYTYPLFGAKRYLRTAPIRRSSYLSPVPVARHRPDYQLQDYDDGFLPTPQDEFEYGGYDKYPFLQYFGYYPTRDYYHDKTARRSSDGPGYFDEAIPQGPMDEDADGDDGYPYGQETWYEEELPRYDANAEANAAFLQNLIMAQMYQDARNQYPFVYDSAGDDYEDQHWFYGVPTTEVEDKEKVKQYFKNKEDEDVRELESLARKKEKSKKLKDPFKKQRKMEVIDKPTKPKSKMTDDEYFDMQKQIIVNSRKNSHAPFPEGLRFSKKQIYNPTENNYWDFHRAKVHAAPHPESATNSIKKLNLIKEEKNTKAFSDSKLKVETTTATVTSTASPKRPRTAGQKEVVLPRPANPVRRPFPEISTRSLHEPSVYDTIKKLLNMEKDLQKSEISQPQKRFVFNEDQLTAELSGLKKLPA